MYNANARDDEQEEQHRVSFGDRIKTIFGLRSLAPEAEEDDGFEDNEPPITTTTRTSYGARTGASMTAPAPTEAPAANMSTRNTTYRLSSVRDSSITIMPANSFTDVQKAADRLKQGEPQILNLEKTAPEVAERLIDFLNGVTYALDGYVEKVADGAYLFTPANMTIHADRPSEQPKPFFDRL